MNKKLFYITLLLLTLTSCQPNLSKLTDGQTITLTTGTLQDKIRGGWAGQTIGVTYGGPTEFRFQGTMIQDYQNIQWTDGYVRWWYENSPGLYDDLYMDLTFVDVFEKSGLDAPVDSFANAFAHAEYPLWHANQVGRYNILHGVKAPQSGYWLNNPHADCIDFQIESDFAGLMSPGMSNTAAGICDKIGHIMNYGDGWYGGVYMSTMYSHAFISNDIDFIVNESLKAIPAKSLFYQCIHDVIQWHKQYPDDWKAAWFEVQKKWTEDVGCPDGVLTAFNIDARVNAAYIVIGLLYGQGDFSKTLDITTRCGQDSDCNPSSAGGILGTVLGYKKIPDYWKKNLREVEDMNFKYTAISLNDVYAIGYKHALQLIQNNGGSIRDSTVSIVYQAPKTVRFEQSFEGMVPVRRQVGGSVLKDTVSYRFEGNGIVVTGGPSGIWGKKSDYVFKVEADLDGVLDTLELPFNFNTRRHEVLSGYQLPVAKHKLKLRLLNPDPVANVLLNDVIIYSDKPEKSVIEKMEK